MTVIFEIEHHLWLDASCQNQNLGKPVGRKNLAGRPKAMSIWHWVNEINTPTTSPYRYMYFDCSSLQLSVLSYEKQHWVNDINTNNQPMWSSTVRAAIGTILSVMKHNKTVANLENFVLGKRLLGENENQKMKQKIQTQATYNNWKITFYFAFSF